MKFLPCEIISSISPGPAGRSASGFHWDALNDHNNINSFILFHAPCTVWEKVNFSPSSRKTLAAPEIEWRKVIGIRNILAHGYFGISLPIIWDVVQNKLDKLYDSCARLVLGDDDK